MPLDRPSSIAARLVQPLWLALVVLLAWFLLESLLFRSGFYYSVLAEPDSNAGAVTMRLVRAEREATPERPTVLVFGDSRVGQGFSEPLAEAVAPGLKFLNVSVPGSRARTWFYLLREMQRRGVPHAAIVVGVPYRYFGGAELADWSLDAAFMAPLVGLSDAGSFPATFASEEMRRRAAGTIWLPALTLQKDVQSLLASPAQRKKSLKRKRWWLGNVSSYAGRDERMPALDFSVDGTVLDWGTATPEQKRSVEQHLTDLSYPPKASSDEFLGRWLGQLLLLARQAGVPLIVYPNPRGPYPQVLPEDEGLPPSLQALADEPDVTVLPSDFLAHLEAPEYFFDAVHANSDGRRLTSEAVARAIAEVLAGDTAAGHQDARR